MRIAIQRLSSSLMKQHFIIRDRTLRLENYNNGLQKKKLIEQHKNFRKNEMNDHKTQMESFIEKKFYDYDK